MSLDTELGNVLFIIDLRNPNLTDSCHKVMQIVHLSVGLVITSRISKGRD